jgi:pimeloyl-ACP methyl ester carboxylesterase
MNIRLGVVIGLLGMALSPERVLGQASNAAIRSDFVRLPDARIHYLEWPGAGATVVLLPGYSLTAHAFREIGQGLSARHRVIAITPRGYGESDAPDSSAYTIATLVSDLRAVLDSLHADRVFLAGHSISGVVVAHFAMRYPERVSRLIFLDAFPYGKAEGGYAVAELDPIPVPPFQGDTTYEAVATWLARYSFTPWRPALEADLRAKPLGAEGARRRVLTARYIEDQWATEPDLTKLRVPSVQLCAIPSVASEYPWIERGTAEYRRAAQHLTETLEPFAQRLCTRFERTVPGGRVVRVPGSHYVFFTNPGVTVRALSPLLR